VLFPLEKGKAGIPAQKGQEGKTLKTFSSLNGGKKMKKIAILLALVVLVSSFGFSQARSGNIYGKVVDADGVALPGVTVTLRSEFSADMTFITTEKGSFRFISLPPGTYSLKAELEGFSIVRRPNLEVELGSNVNITVEMVPRTVEEEITVIAASPVIDKKLTSRALHLTIEELQVLPTSRDPWVILELAPGVVMDRENVGGSESGQQSYFASAGQGRRTATWNLMGSIEVARFQREKVACILILMPLRKSRSRQLLLILHLIQQESKSIL